MWTIRLAIAITISVGIPARGQDRAETPSPAPDRQARRLVTFLELPGRRAESATALLRLGPVAVPALARGLRHPTPEVVCCCVQLLAKLGPRGKAALPQLRRLAASPDPIRAHAGAFGLAAVRDLGIVSAIDVDKDVVWELDRQGKVLRKIPAGVQIYDAERLPDGSYLFSQLNLGRVVEMGADGKVRWSHDGCRKPLAAERLPGGNTLIAGGQAGEVVEVDREGEVVWRWKGTSWPNDADRLPGGNTLVCDSPASRIFEVDRSGDVVWSLKVAHGVVDVQRLENGNTLYVRATGKGVVEVNPKGETVWEYSENRPQSAFRNRDGSTVIGAARSVLLVDPAGKTVWRHDGVGRIKAVHRY